jgi:peptidoglycan/xylan/chitin deacetylase (PgdA/CDA1 family)
MTILCFHKVGPVSQEGRRLNIEPESLERIIAWLKRRGNPILLARDLPEDLSQKGAVLSFDDAYLSTLTFGVEAMKRQDVRGSIYAVSCLVGKESSWDEGGPAPLADFDLLRSAHQEGFEIGNHTDVHPFLGRLPEEAQMDHINSCRRRLEAEGLPTATFCYPYGSLNQDSPAALQRAGYRIGLALGKRSPRPGDDPRALPRIVVACRDGVPGVAYKMFLKPVIAKVLGKAK